jgi:hypothetical protein
MEIIEIDDDENHADNSADAESDPESHEYIPRKRRRIDEGWIIYVYMEKVQSLLNLCNGLEILRPLRCNLIIALKALVKAGLAILKAFEKA